MSSLPGGTFLSQGDSPWGAGAQFQACDTFTELPPCTWSVLARGIPTVGGVGTLPAHREFMSLGEGGWPVILISDVWYKENEYSYVTGRGGQGVFLEEGTSGRRTEGREELPAIQVREELTG